MDLISICKTDEVLTKNLVIVKKIIKKVFRQFKSDYDLLLNMKHSLIILNLVRISFNVKDPPGFANATIFYLFQSFMTISPKYSTACKAHRLVTSNSRGIIKYRSSIDYLLTLTSSW